jgi:YHS domain-containing protein
MSTDKKRILVLILASVGIGFLGWIFLNMGKNMQEEKERLRQVCIEQAEGIVYEYPVKGYEKMNAEGNYSPKSNSIGPVFKYEVGGKTYLQQSQVNKKRFKPNQKVTVRYNPANPSEYFVPEDKAEQGNGKIIIGFAYFLLVVGAIGIGGAVFKIVKRKY